ncbi:hypothetical protein HPTD01_2487 [Halomonas sp. TD01]|nr:hypothetical protein HPTD01_2484 [Halomonas sp. TD01]CAH1044009.1 hypothetical protein HPTD01_2487 [Halomonas sp. TD01]
MPSVDFSGCVARGKPTALAMTRVPHSLVPREIRYTALR